MNLVLGGCKTGRSLHLPTRILEVYIEALTGFSTDGPTPQYYLKALWDSVQGSESKQNAYSKDREGGGEPLIAWVQLSGQLVVTSSQ